MAESERYLPSLLDKIEPMLEEAGLQDKEIVIRMTGCPNGCARPMLAEIAFIGKAPGKYNMYLGGGFAGNRLNKLYKENIGEAEILESLRPIIPNMRKNGRKASISAISSFVPAMSKKCVQGRIFIRKPFVYQLDT